ncbi:uncharacterized protein LOC117343354 [Pecten maximus]|uniref:uncharacterized protein LOC117343354 n=1 Tax=Pecten maximus TaxID=6579 RepID=UPI001458AB03|nr:uncharacterized protein LOC117343354 [Pecten maximus]
METKDELEKIQSQPDDTSNGNIMQPLASDVCKCEAMAQEEIATSEKDGDTSCMSSCQRLLLKLKTNKVYRQKMIYVVCLFASKFVCGWGKGLFGPSYIDIRMISGSNLDQGSWILTANLIGFALGSISQGFLYGRVNSRVLFGMASCVYCTAVVLVPWCTLFEAMVFSYIAIGLMQGILSSGTSTDIIRLWGKESRVVFLGCWASGMLLLRLSGVAEVFGERETLMEEALELAEEEERSRTEGEIAKRREKCDEKTPTKKTGRDNSTMSYLREKMERENKIKEQ